MGGNKEIGINLGGIRKRNEVNMIKTHFKKSSKINKNTKTKELRRLKLMGSKVYLTLH